MIKGLEGTHLHSLNYICEDCGHKDQSYGDMTDGEIMFDTFDPCEDCSSVKLRWIMSVPSIDRYDERLIGGVFDRGLGRVIHSKKHRMEVCKELGCVPLDGDVDISAGMRQARNEEARDLAVVTAMKDRAENDPKFAPWRKQRDSGVKEKFKHTTKPESQGWDPFNDKKEK